MLIFEFSPEDAGLLGPYRNREGWEVCGESSEREGNLPPGQLWLRCPESEAVEELMAGLPCAGRYRVEGGKGSLVPLGKKLPVGRLPAGPWVKLVEWLNLEGPQAMLPGRCQERVAVSLTRSEREEPPAALMLDLETLAAWAEGASRLRMNRLRFAVSASGLLSPGNWNGSLETGTNTAGRGARALVIGEPPPGVPGLPFYWRGRLLLPCGWDFTLPLRAEWVEESMALPPGAVAVFDTCGEVELLEQESFAPLSLSAVRRTARGLGLAFSAGNPEF